MDKNRILRIKKYKDELNSAEGYNSWNEKYTRENQ